MIGAGNWRLVRCDEQAIVTASRQGEQCVLRFVLLDPLTTWTFAVDGDKATMFLADVAAAWKPAETIIGPAPAAPIEELP